MWRPTGTISPVSSSSGTNSIGATRAALGMLPAHERLHAGHVAPREVHDRLVAQRELARVERPLQVGLQLQAGQRAGVHLGLEDLVVALAVLLGHVHRRVGVAQQFLGVRGRDHVLVAEGDPDAGRRASRRGRRARSAPSGSSITRLGDLDRLQLALGVVDQDRELVAAEARGGVDRAHAVLQAPSDLLQDLVAGGVAEASR